MPSGGVARGRPVASGTFRRMAKLVSASGRVVIARPVDEVFGFFADGENDPIWRAGVKSIKRVGEPGVGCVYEQTVAGPGGRSISADVRVTGFQPNQRVEFEAISGPVRPQGVYEFAEADGGTEVTFSLRAELGGVKAMLMAGTVQKTMDAEVAGLTRAKAHLESS